MQTAAEGVVRRDKKTPKTRAAAAMDVLTIMLEGYDWMGQGEAVARRG